MNKMSSYYCSAEALFLNATEIIKPSGIFYVGAYQGGCIEMFKDFKCPVYAFEPNPAHWNKIQDEYNKHGVNGKLCTFGLANFSQELDLNIPDSDQIASSFLQTKTISSMFPHISLKNSTKATVVPLDALQITDCNYLILDVQGFEVNAILGGYKTILENVDVIITESSTDELYSCQNTVVDLHLLIEELGFFSMSELDHIHSDIIYIKNKYRNDFKDLPLITHPIVSRNKEDFTLKNFGYNKEWSRA